MKKPPIGRLLCNVLGAESIHFIAFLLPFGRIRMSESTSRAELTISCFFVPHVSVIVVLEREGKF